MKWSMIFFIYSLLFVIFQFTVFAHVTKNQKVNCSKSLQNSQPLLFEALLAVKIPEDHFTKQNKNLY